MLRRSKIEKRWLSRAQRAELRNAKLAARDARARAREERRKQRADHKHFRHVPDVQQATPAETEYRHGGWAERRQQILDAMIAANLNSHALERFVNCGSGAYVYEYTDEQGGWNIHANHCHNRYCKPCAKSHALMIGDNLWDKLTNGTRKHVCGKFLHVVLTKVHVKAPLPDQVNAIYENFKSLRSTKLWKRSIKGGAAFFQSHVCKDGMWHCHLHITAESPWLDKFDLSAQWKRITGGSTNVDVKRIVDAQRVVREVTRYASRPIDDDKVVDHDQLVELMTALRGRHLCFTFGSWRGFKLCQPPKRPKRPEESRGPLIDWIMRANAGEVHAQKVLEVLRTKTCASQAPPEDAHYL